MGDDVSISEKPWEVSRDRRWNYLFETKLGNDAVLVLGPQKQEVKVHRFILEMSSEIFYKDFQKVDNNRIIIEEVDPQHFIMFLRHLYVGESDGSIKIRVKYCLPLLQIATKYQVEDLMTFCVAKLSLNLTIENVAFLFEQAMEIGHKDVTEQSLKFICRNGQKTVNLENFLELRQECLYEILKRDDLMVASEIELFNAVLRWGVAECSRQQLDCNEPQNLRKVLEKVLGLIRFPLMDKEEFTLKIAMKNILTDKELISILLFFNVSKKKRILIPQGRFNASPRSACRVRSVVGAVLRLPQFEYTSEDLDYGPKRCQEILLLKVDKRIALLELKLFDPPEDYRDDSDGDPFPNIHLILEIKEVGAVGRRIYKQESGSFEAFDPLNLQKEVTLKANRWYSITAVVSGLASVCPENETPGSWDGFQVVTGLISDSCVECEQNGKVEKVNFQFRRDDHDDMEIEQGLIEYILFKLK